MSVANVLNKVENNVKARLNSGKTALSNEVSAVKALAGNLLGLKPVIGLVDFGIATTTNVGTFVKDQARILRGWAQ